MENKEQEQPDFQNDMVTDWVLRGSDPSLKTEEEMINAKPDAEKKDCWFPIHFTFRGVDYTADVLKMERTVIEYHVTAVLPIIDYLPDPFIVALTLSKKAFDFPVNEDHYPQQLGLLIVAAIGNGCDQAQVALA